MASKITDPGLGMPDVTTADAAATDPMGDALATTEVTIPGVIGEDTTDPERGDSLLEGLRRERPPPRLSPRIRAESEGGEAVAYYAGPQSLPARFDTPPLESAIEIATTPASTATQPIHARIELGSPPINRVVAPHLARALAETVPARGKRRSSRTIIIAGSAVLFGTVLASWYAMGRAQETMMDRTPTADSVASLRTAPATSGAPPPVSVAPALSATTGALSPPASAPSSQAAAPAARPTVHPTLAAAVATSSTQPARDAPRPPGASPPAPSHEPRIPAPPTAPAVPSAKIDHVRTI